MKLLDHDQPCIHERRMGHWVEKDKARGGRVEWEWCPGGAEVTNEIFEALHKEWQENHFEHCGRQWPHPEGKTCHWPQPTVLVAWVDDA